MTIPVKLKRSGTTTATPSSLEYGEIAINYADGVVFYRDSSDVIQSFTLQAYALSSHTHAASDITSGTLDAARLPPATTGAVGGVIVGTGLGVSSGTVSVTYGTTSGTACQGNDSRLSDARTPTDGSVTTAKIADDAVTYAKIQNVSTTDRLLGRSSAGAGDVEEVTCTAFGRSLIDDVDAAAARSTLGVQPTASPAFTGAATVTNDGNVVPLTVTNTGTANSFVVNDASGDTSPFVINASGDVAIGTSSPSAKLDVHGTIRCGAGSTDPGTGAVMYLVGSGFFQTVIAGAAFGVHTGGNNARTERFFINGSGVSTFSGQLLVTAGSASAPGVAFGPSDTNTGMFSPGADQLALSTAGVSRLVIEAAGHVRFVGNSYEDFSDFWGVGDNRGFFLPYGFIGSNGSSAVSIYANGYRNNSAGFTYMDIGGNTATACGMDLLPTGVFRLRTGAASGTQPPVRLEVGADGSVLAPDVYGDTVGATNRDLFIDNTGKLGYVSSIRASKTNIAAIDDVSWLRDLTPVSFHYRKRNEDGTYSDEPDGTLDYGLIAEEVEPVAPELCFYDVVDGEPQLRGVHYSKLITPMLRYIQQLEQRIAALEEKLNHA